MEKVMKSDKQKAKEYGEMPRITWLFIGIDIMLVLILVGIWIH